MSVVRRGDVFVWSSLIPPPEGYQFLPHSMRYGRHEPLGIVSLREHDEPPRVPESMLDYIERNPGPQDRLLARRDSERKPDMPLSSEPASRVEEIL